MRGIYSTHCCPGDEHGECIIKWFTQQVTFDLLGGTILYVVIAVRYGNNRNTRGRKILWGLTSIRAYLVTVSFPLVPLTVSATV